MKNAKPDLILNALLKFPTVRDAAESLSIPESTVYAWLRKPDFKERYNEAKRQMLSETTTFLQSKLTEATQVILDLMSGEDTPPAVRLNAARSVFEFCAKLTRSRPKS